MYSVCYYPIFLPQQVSGVGRLVFETVRGVRGHLQTEAGAVLRTQLELLGADRLPAELVRQALTAALLAAARHLRQENAATLWTELWVRCTEWWRERVFMLSLDIC